MINALIRKSEYGTTELSSVTFDTYFGIFRIAAAIATRKHILGVHISNREQYYDVLLPRLCLCRYFMADTKFLLYSQESWRLIVNTDGPQLVEKYIDKVVSVIGGKLKMNRTVITYHYWWLKKMLVCLPFQVNFYLEATGSENHAAREAACACIAELSRKINPTLVRPFIPVLLEALKRSFHDERWHVRDCKFSKS